MSATVLFREGTVGDRDAILALRALAFPDDDPEKRQADFWNWEFIDGYAGAARIFVAEAGDEIVGHFAFIPQRFATPQIVRGALAVDVMTHPQFRRQKKEALDADHDRGRLLGMRSRADLEIDDRLRHAQILEEDFGHALVVMLAGVDDLVVDAGRTKGLVNGSGLHEVRPRANDGDNHEREFIIMPDAGRRSGDTGIRYPARKESLHVQSLWSKD